MNSKYSFQIISPGGKAECPAQMGTRTCKAGKPFSFGYTMQRLSCLFLFIFLLLFFYNCKTGNYQVIKSKNTQSIIFNGSISPIIPIKSNEKHYLLDGYIQNGGKKNLYYISAKIYFIQDQEIIQERGPFVLYESQTPLKPNYKANFTKIINLPLISWDGKKFEVKFIKTTTEKKTAKKVSSPKFNSKKPPKPPKEGLKQ